MDIQKYSEHDPVAVIKKIKACQLSQEFQPGYSISSSETFELNQHYYYKVWILVKENQFCGTAEIDFGIKSRGALEQAETLAIERALAHAGFAFNAPKAAEKTVLDKKTKSQPEINFLDLIESTKEISSDNEQPDIMMERINDIKEIITTLMEDGIKKEKLLKVCHYHTGQDSLNQLHTVPYDKLTMFYEYLKASQENIAKEKQRFLDEQVVTEFARYQKKKD